MRNSPIPSADEIEFPADIEIKKPAAKKSVQPPPTKPSSDDVALVAEVDGIFDMEGRRHNKGDTFTVPKEVASLIVERKHGRLA